MVDGRSLLWMAGVGGALPSVWLQASYGCCALHGPPHLRLLTPLPLALLGCGGRRRRRLPDGRLQSILRGYKGFDIVFGPSLT